MSQDQLQPPNDESVRSRGRNNLQAMAMSRAPSTEHQEIFVLPRQKSRSRDRRESRMFLVDGQLCWADDPQAPGSGGGGGGGYSGRRSSSVGLMFGSSMDLSGIGQSIDSSGGGGSGSEEAISYRIKWCRENIIQLKRQTWPMEKKLQVLKASKLFIKQHQGDLKQSKQAKDVIASTSAIFERYWRHFKREFANFLVIITPWEMRIKKIESHFGSVVASYFTFLRWIFWLNLANSLVMCSFVMVPELIENVPDPTGMRKGELGMQQPLGSDGKAQPPPEFNPTLGEMWEFEGFLKFSPIFYGYYSNVEISRSGFWRNPLAFLMSAMITYLFCFFCISRKLSQNTKLSRIGSKDDEYTFCWTVFVGWDFMIGNSETAYNKTSSLVMNLKEGILEEKEQTKDRDWRLIIRRVFANVLTIMLIIASAYVVTLAVQRSENLPEDASLLQKNELQLVMSGIQFMFPPLFDVIGIIEKYHPRKALSWQLGRILFLDFLNFYTLMFSLFGTVDQMGIQLNEMSGNITQLRKNATYYHNLFTTTTTSTTTTTTTTTTQSPLTSTVNQDTLVSNTTLMDLATNSSATINLNASTLLTTVLLASSTIAPTTNMNTTSLSSSATMLYSSTTISSTSILPIDLTSVVINSVATATITTTTEPSTTTTATTTTEEKLSSITTMTIPSTKSNPEEDDYPDLGEVLKSPSVGRKKREVLNQWRDRRPIKRNRKRKTSINLNQDSGREVEDDDQVIRFSDEEQEFHTSGNDQDLTRRSQPQVQQQQFGRVFGSFLPPIQDPYRKLGRTQLPPPQIAVFPNQLHHEDEEEEEPIEGRLVASKSSSITTTARSAISKTKRPAIKAPGVARPIEGERSRQRVQLLSTSSRPPIDLYDDNNEDSEENLSPFSGDPTTSSPINNDNFSKGSFVEPSTSPASAVDGGVNIALGPDYSIVGADTTTNPGTMDTVTTSQANDASSVAQSNQEEPQGKSGLLPAVSSGDEQNLTKPPDDMGSTPYMDPISESGSLPTSCTPKLVVDNGSSINNRSLVSNLKSSAGFNASEVNYADCIEIPDFKHQEILSLNNTLKDKLKSLCWETMFGQEMVKIVVMDLVMTVVSAVSFEFMRACFVRYCNRFFFWDLERGFPGYQDFKLAENVLHLVNNQSTVWMGMFFAPGLPAINTVKLAVLMYVRSWAVLTCNIPHETVFKVSKSNNFYYWILLINLLICILPVAYAVTWIRPSWHCGPFGGECRMYIVVTKLVKSLLPPEANSVFKYLTSPGAVIPILIALILIIYYLASTVSSSKEANKELKAQLKKDKEQEAAVPEITNTTVIDTTAAVQPVIGTANPQVPISGNAPIATSGGELIPPKSSPSEEVQNLLSAANLQPVGSKLGNFMALNAAQQVPESKPKSLLMPPAP